MTQEEITQNNSIIAKFMGMQETHLGWYDAEKSIPLPTMEVTFEFLEFHLDWNWLMPVVEAIEGMGYNTELVYRPDDGGHCMYIYDSPVFSSQMGGKMEAVYKAVVEFIKWYNENNKHG